MRFDGAILKAAGQLFLPLIFLFGLSVLATRAPGEGGGFAAGLVVALGMALHVLIFGAEAARRAIPGQAARALLASGVVIAFAGAGFRYAIYARQTLEFGLFLCVIGAAALVLTVLIGRAPSMSDEHLE